MPSGTVNQSGPLPKPRAAKAKSSPVAIEKPSGFRSSICSTSPPTIQSIGPGWSASRARQAVAERHQHVPDREHGEEAGHHVGHRRRPDAGVLRR